MADESISQLRISIDKLKGDIEIVEAKYTLARKDVGSSYITELSSQTHDKLDMIRSAVDAFLSKCQPTNEHPQTRVQRGRENRDSGLPSSVDSAVFRSRDSSVLEDIRLNALALEEDKAPTSTLHQQCPSCHQHVQNPLQETETPDGKPSGKVSTENEDIQRMVSGEETNKLDTFEM